MKKYFCLFLFIGMAVSLRAQTITVTDVYSNSYCTETLYSIGFTATGSFSGDNVFEAQLSDSLGNFSASSLIIGRISSLTAGVTAMDIIIPPAVPPGTRYSIRVISTDPVKESPVNYMPLTISSASAPALTIGGDSCLTDNPLVAIGIVNASAMQWYQDISTKVEDTTAEPSFHFSIVAGGNDTGSGPKQLYGPNSLFVDGKGNIYVSDVNNFRIQKFPPNSTADTPGITVAGGNGQGSENNQFYAEGIFVDGDGNLYVADIDNSRVLQFPPGSSSLTKGVVVAGGNGSGSGADQLNDPAAVYVDGNGNLYVSDGWPNERVQKFPPNSTSATPGVTVAGGNGEGNDPDQFNSPFGIFVDGNGNLYVNDALNNRIQKFPPGSTSSTPGITVAGGNGPGSAPNQLLDASNIYVDGGGNLYVMMEGYEIARFPAGSTSATNGKTVIYDPVGYQFTMDGSGNIYVTDFDSSRVSKFHTTVTDTTYNPPGPGSYTAAYTDWAGCVSPPSNTISKYNPQPAPAVIRIGNELMSANKYLFYFWFVNDSIIGADSILNLSQNGDYKLGVIDSNNCAQVSGILTVTDVGITNVAQPRSLNLYPDPNSGTFLLETSNSTGNEFRVYDMMGNTILNQQITSDRQIITLKPIAAGMYMLQIKGSAENPTRFTVYE